MDGIVNAFGGFSGPVSIASELGRDILFQGGDADGSDARPHRRKSGPCRRDNGHNHEWIPHLFILR